MLLFRRPLTRWNARTGNAMRSEHIRQVAEPFDGAPGYIAGGGGLMLAAGVVLAVVGALQA
ncbi:hypothetical protein DQ239_01290 [Blastococcus sp. TF02-09]|uniref:hypothetical protein n=1 Tax=Blastococcus sp. TF02-09 TaxID=2250576 RepID=UPI000DE8B3CE|nr:hypothetical protein [Blastococcus sp. TF02-9]RBY81277.1 hypothetical protein DQ239_01290 [Blastococcus sp. TF02-9]